MPCAQVSGVPYMNSLLSESAGLLRSRVPPMHSGVRFASLFVMILFSECHRFMAIDSTVGGGGQWVRGDTCVVFGLGCGWTSSGFLLGGVAFTLSTVIWQGCGGGLLQL